MCIRDIYNAVLWAVEQGITVGTSATTFSPDATVTRAQNVTFLWRWAKSPATKQVNSFTAVSYTHLVPIWEKANLTIDEAAAYFGIGTNKLREITSNPDCEFVIRVGAKRLIKRKKFERYLEDVDTV